MYLDCSDVLTFRLLKAGTSRELQCTGIIYGCHLLTHFLIKSGKRKKKKKRSENICNGIAIVDQLLAIKTENQSIKLKKNKVREFERFQTVSPVLGITAKEPYAYGFNRARVEKAFTGKKSM